MSKRHQPAKRDWKRAIRKARALLDAAGGVLRSKGEAGSATEGDLRAFFDKVRRYGRARGFDRPDVRAAIAAGTYRAPGFVITDAKGYDRALAKRSVGPGWGALVDEVFDLKETHAPSVKIVQVKEKFATLHIYFEGDAAKSDEYEAVSDLVREIERLSATTCERCGAPGAIRDGSWFKTLCDTHAGGRPRAEGWP